MIYILCGEKKENKISLENTKGVLYPELEISIHVL